MKLPWIRDISELHALRRRALADIYLRPYYVAHYGWNVLRNLNTPLLRYAWQELGKTIRSG